MHTAYPAMWESASVSLTWLALAPMINASSASQSALYAPGDWLKGKSHDSWGPVGPWLVTRLAAPRIETRNTHGTGCTLSSAIAAGLAQGMSLDEACVSAKKYLTGALAAADKLDVGQGSGPVHHFFDMWDKGKWIKS